MLLGEELPATPDMDLACQGAGEPYPTGTSLNLPRAWEQNSAKSAFSS